MFLKRSAWANGVFKTRNENHFSDCPNCDYEDSCSVGQEKLREMFPPRQIFGVVFDDDGTRTIYKVTNRFVDFLPTKSPAGYSWKKYFSLNSSALREMLSEHFLVLSRIGRERKTKCLNRCTFNCTFCRLHIDTQCDFKFSLIACYQLRDVSNRATTTTREK